MKIGLILAILTSMVQIAAAYDITHKDCRVYIVGLSEFKYYIETKGYVITNNPNATLYMEQRCEDYSNIAGACVEYTVGLANGDTGNIYRERSASVLYFDKWKALTVSIKDALSKLPNCVERESYR